MNSVDVRCSPSPAGDGSWWCEADVGDGRTTGRHTVVVAAEDARRLGAFGGATPEGATRVGSAESARVERLVRETFAFLLEREPRSSILTTFDLAVVRRYFPEYESELRRRLGG